MVVQKIMVKIQKIEMQAVLRYHFSDDSVSTQRVKPPNTNNRIGNAIFISYSSLSSHLAYCCPSRNRRVVEQHLSSVYRVAYPNFWGRVCRWGFDIPCSPKSSDKAYCYHTHSNKVVDDNLLFPSQVACPNF